MNDQSLMEQTVGEVKKVIAGKDDLIEKMFYAILAQGHLLIEDIPGVGKTTLALAFAKAMSLKSKRAQFTPDSLPSDITGFSVLRADGRMEYQPGAAMCNLFLADEINRTSPRTQSALLEVMEEGNVTVDGVTHEVPQPFIVIATQNPSGSAGTQALPESQLDRFIAKFTVGYPETEDEIDLLKGKEREKTLPFIRQVLDVNQLLRLRKNASEVFADDKILEYIVRIARLTREHPMIRLGMSPRGTLALCAMAKACAYCRGRDYVIPEDVQYVARETMEHRIFLTTREVTAAELIGEIMKSAGSVEARLKG